MVLSNAFRPDPRVLKEARSLAVAGYEVTVIAWDREGKYPAEELARSETGQSGEARLETGSHPGGVGQSDEFGVFTVQRVQDVRSSYGAGLAQALRLPRFWLHAWRRLNRLRPDVVHCHDFDTLPPGWLWAKVHRRPVIYDAHEYYTELQRPRLRGLAGKVLLPLIAAAEQVLSRSATAVVTVDERIASRYQNGRIVIVGHYPPVDFARGVARSETGHSIDEAGETARSEAGQRSVAMADAPSITHHASPTLVYAGRFSTDRGMVVIANALQRLAAQELRPRLRLLGTWTSQTEEQAFWRAMAGLEHQVEMVGWAPFDQVPAQLAGADVALAVLQPVERYTVALPVKLFEYMACGLPVIISDFPANRVVVANAGCGILVDPTNVDAVAAAIARLIADPAEARRLGDNGRRAFESQYNWQSLEPKLLALYAELK